MNKKLIRTLVFLVVFILFLFVAVSGFLWFLFMDDASRPFAFVVGLVALCVTVIWRMVYVFQKETSELKRQLITQSDAIGQNVAKAIEPLLDNKVSVCSNAAEVIDGIANVYNSACDTAKAHGESDSLNAHNTKITLFGASDVQTIAIQKASASDDDSAFHRFVRAQDRVEKEGIRVERYVRLFDQRNFMGRSPTIRNGYLKWIERQISLLKGNGDYHLIDAKRAPRWKAIRSSVSSSDLFIDILGDGEAGFVISGSSFVETQVKNSEIYLRSAKSRGGGIIQHYTSKNVYDLEKHLKDMRKLKAKSKK